MPRKIDPTKPRNWTHNHLKAFKPQDKRYDIHSDQFPGLRCRVYPSGRKTWVVDYRFQCKRQTLTLGIFPQLSHASARDLATTAFADSPDPASMKSVKKAEAKRERVKKTTGTLKAFLEGDYKKRVLDHRRSGDATEKRIRAAFKTWLDTPLEDLDWKALERHQQRRLKQSKSPATLNRDRTALISLVNSAIERDVIKTNPLAKWKPVKVEQDRRVRYLGQFDKRERFPKGERQRLDDALVDALTPAHLRDIVRVAMLTGLRRGELFDLTWGDVDLDSQQLAVRASSSKAGKTRHVPLNPTALEVLRGRHDDDSQPDDFVFPNPLTGERLTTIKKSWAALMERTQISDFRFHDLRHDFASRLVMSGVDLNTVRELMGHTTMEMTLRYAHLAPEHKADAVAKLS
jgi:integrase